VKLVQVDAVGPQAAQAVVARPPDVLRPGSPALLVDLPPNFVAITTALRRLPSARPTYSSLFVPP